MEEGASSILEMFYKRRRDLMLISTLTILVRFLSIKVSSLNILGMAISIENTQLIPWLSAIALCYYTLRFYQYAHELDDNKFSLGYEDGLIRSYIAHLKKTNDLVKKYGLKRKDFLRPLLFRPFGQKGGSDIIVEHEFESRAGIDRGITIISRTRFKIFRLKAVLYIAVTTKLVTDLLVPYLLALLAFFSTFLY